MRYPKPYRPAGQSRYYFWYKDPDGKRHMKATHCERAGDAHDFIRMFIDARSSRSGNQPFKEYQVPYFRVETCPHIQRLKDEGQHIGLTHITKCRQWLDRWVVPDAVFCRRPMNQITRGDLTDLRTRIRKRVLNESKRIRGEGMATVNKTISALGTIFFEAHLRGDIPRNPALRMKPVVYKKAERDILTLAEHHQLFDAAWQMEDRTGELQTDELGHDVFEFAALTGMRCSEVLAMVPDRQLRGDVLSIDYAFKGKEEGKPKHEKTRQVILCERARELAAKYPAGFRYQDGKRLGETWWKQHFAAGLVAAKIVAGSRSLTPHCLRHSLNTHLLQAGVDPLRVQLYLWGKRGGEGEQGTTNEITRVQAIYTHFEARMTEPVARAIERLYGRAQEKEKQA